MELDDIITDGKHITQLRTVLVKSMGENGADKLINNILELIQELPSAEEGSQNRHGLLLGYIQSGKTFAFTTAIALAADNGYRLFIILTSNNLILYNQTIDERLKQDLQSIEVEGKDSWEQKILMMTQTLKDPKGVLVLVTTKNTAILYKLEQTLRTIQEELKMGLPIALIIDDEADEGGLDTNTRRRSVNPLIEAGPTFSAIEEIRRLVPNHVRLQVTATPQALFLQDSGHESRPGFTVLLEPGADYVGSEQFFALKQEIDMIYENDDENELEERKSKIIRRIDQHDIHMMIEQEGDSIPDSLRDALLTFYIGATIKIVDEPSTRFSFLCHISARKADHDKISQIINKYIGVLRKSLIDYVDNNITSEDIYYLEKYILT